MADGTKERQQPREPQGDGWEYREWRRKLGSGLLTQDVDYVEYRLRNGELVPVAVIEVTRVRDNLVVPQSYLDAIVERYDRDRQGEATTTVARALGVYAYIVLYRYDLSEFWAFNLTTRAAWRNFTPEQMVEFLRTREPLQKAEVA